LLAYAHGMKNYKNYLIAILSGLLVFSLSTQQAQSAGKSKEAKIVEYQFCIENSAVNAVFLEDRFNSCAKYRP
jgi:hypothetical protein